MPRTLGTEAPKDGPDDASTPDFIKVGRNVRRMVLGWQQVLYGAGRVDLDPGNRDNAPGDPPVQVGNYEWIIPQMWPSQDIVAIGTVPTEFQDWGQYGINVYDPSGLEGGGYSGDVPQVDNGPVLFYDSQTGLYIAGVQSL